MLFLYFGWQKESNILMIEAKKRLSGKSVLIRIYLDAVFLKIIRAIFELQKSTIYQIKA